MARINPFRDRPDIVLSAAQPQAAAVLSHATNIKRLNIMLDALVVVARLWGLMPRDATVAVVGARYQNFRGTRAAHAAHGMKRFTFDGREIFAYYSGAEMDADMAFSIRTKEGSCCPVAPIANLSIDRSLENNPARRLQLQMAVKGTYDGLGEAAARVVEMELERRHFDLEVLDRLQDRHRDNPACLGYLAVYEKVLCDAPILGDGPAAMVQGIAAMMRQS